MRYFTPQSMLCLLVLVTSTLAFHVHVATESPDYRVDARREYSSSPKPKNPKYYKKSVSKQSDRGTLVDTKSQHIHRHPKKPNRNVHRGKHPSIYSTLSGRPTFPESRLCGEHSPKRPVKTPSEGKGPKGKALSSGNEVDQTQNLALEEINRFRSTHGADPLQTSAELVRDAVAWASECNYAHTRGAFTGKYGEILAWTSGEIPGNMTKAIELWTAEEKDYNPNNPIPSHFTQVVWKSSRSLGCATNYKCNKPDGTSTVKGSGIDQNAKDAVLYICRFLPAGNIMDKQTMNANVQLRKGRHRE